MSSRRQRIKEPSDGQLNAISLEYPYEELRASTDGFSAANKVGQGAYGNVFKAVLRDGNEVAIKYLHSGQPAAGFEEEVKVLSKFRHQNLVILMGFARHDSQRLLVYELLPGGDVGSRLQKGPLLGWRQRVNIALDSACGLSHLHNQHPKVFHRDIKSANILLDRNGTAKWGDFGLACLSAKLSHKVLQTAGTVGYADPQYISSSVVTENTEVYSYGWVLIELLTAKPPAVQHHDGKISYFFSKLKDPKTGTASLRNLLCFIDDSACFPEPIIIALAKLALRCINPDESFRPDFRSIVLELRKLAADCDIQYPGGGITDSRDQSVSKSSLPLRASDQSLMSHRVSQVTPSPHGALGRMLNSERPDVLAQRKLRENLWNAKLAPAKPMVGNFFPMQRDIGASIEQFQGSPYPSDFTQTSAAQFQSSLYNQPKRTAPFPFEGIAAVKAIARSSESRAAEDPQNSFAYPHCEPGRVSHSVSSQRLVTAGRKSHSCSSSAIGNSSSVSEEFIPMSSEIDTQRNVSIPQRLLESHGNPMHSTLSLNRNSASHVSPSNHDSGTPSNSFFGFNDPNKSFRYPSQKSAICSPQRDMRASSLNASQPGLIVHQRTRLAESRVADYATQQSQQSQQAQQAQSSQPAQQPQPTQSTTAAPPAVAVRASPPRSSIPATRPVESTPTAVASVEKSQQEVRNPSRPQPQSSTYITSIPLRQINSPNSIAAPMPLTSTESPQKFSRRFGTKREAPKQASVDNAAPTKASVAPMKDEVVVRDNAANKESTRHELMRKQNSIELLLSRTNSLKERKSTPEPQRRAPQPIPPGALTERVSRSSGESLFSFDSGRPIPNDVTRSDKTPKLSRQPRPEHSVSKARRGASHRDGYNSRRESESLGSPQSQFSLKSGGSERSVATPVFGMDEESLEDDFRNSKTPKRMRERSKDLQKSKASYHCYKQDNRMTKAEAAQLRSSASKTTSKFSKSEDSKRSIKTQKSPESSEISDACLDVPRSQLVNFQRAVKADRHERVEDNKDISLVDPKGRREKSLKSRRSSPNLRRPRFQAELRTNSPESFPAATRKPNRSAEIPETSPSKVDFMDSASSESIETKRLQPRTREATAKFNTIQQRISKLSEKALHSEFSFTSPMSSTSLLPAMGMAVGVGLYPSILSVGCIDEESDQASASRSLSKRSVAKSLSTSEMSTEDENVESADSTDSPTPPKPREVDVVTLSKLCSGSESYALPWSRLSTNSGSSSMHPSSLGSMFSSSETFHMGGCAMMTDTILPMPNDLVVRSIGTPLDQPLV